MYYHDKIIIGIDQFNLYNYYINTRKKQIYSLPLLIKIFLIFFVYLSWLHPTEI